MSVPHTAGNFASIVTERAGQCVVRAQPLPVGVRPNCCPGLAATASAAAGQPGGITSQMLTLRQQETLATCDYSQALALAKARGQAPEPSCVRIPFTNQRRVPPARCGPSQEDANAGQPIPVPTCYNLIGITQTAIN